MSSPAASASSSSAPSAGRRFNFNRAQVVDENFVAFVRGLGGMAAAERRPADDSPLSDDGASTITARDLVELFESQLASRHCDLMSRVMRATNDSFYTIGSVGHEGNAVVGRLTRFTDPAFLHYRSGGFMAERYRQRPEMDFVAETMLSFTASSRDPISGGRHKVWGSLPLWVPPQTSTIASHLPKAVGAAVSLGRAKKLRLIDIPADSIVVCSFGDASVNHAVAQTAFNAAARIAYEHLPVPVLFVCEDNGIGISVHTPEGWVEASMSRRPGIAYFGGTSLDLAEGHRVTREAVEHCRSRRAPVFLHLRTVRMLGHAGTDPESEYHAQEQIEAAEARDPLLVSARLIVEHGLMTPAEVVDLYERTRERVRAAGDRAKATPKLTSAAEIVRPLAPCSPDAVRTEARRIPPEADRLRHFGGEAGLPEKTAPRHMAALINHGLADTLIKYPESFIFGEDVAKRGGVYYVTAKLSEKFGLGRVFNSILDETTILGLAVGAGHFGLLPIPEIQYLAYLHNAEDQLRGEAASLQFFSNAQYRNPMVVRVAGWAYQKGFGGHFHNDNSIAVLRDIPGLVVCTAARGDDAVRMMRTCTALAKVDGRVVVFIEPIALYMTKDLHAPKDGGWQFTYPAPGEAIDLGEAAVYHEEAKDLTIVTFANGLYMSLRAAKTLREKHGLSARVCDLRWLCPLNESFIVEQARATGRVLVVDESRRAGGIAESIMAVIGEQCGGEVRAARINSMDTFIPLGPAADLVLVGEADIIAAARRLAGR